MNLEFYGAAGEVTGSCHILTVQGRRFLLDCGMIQGGRKAERRNRDPFPFDASGIEAVILSHAHIDHSGRLPLLVRRGFKGEIHTHNASRDLCDILLRDSAYLGERDTERENRRRARMGKKPLEPLYTADDAAATMKKMQGHRYAQRIEVAPGVQVEFHDAGHIMGSAIVDVRAEENGVRRRIVFSGDLGQYDTPILRDPAAIDDADLVLMESTYGGRRHRDRSETLKEIGDIVKDDRRRRGNLLIPAFAVGRSQEILYNFGKHFSEWGMDRWQIFLDSPMAIEASKIYWDYPHLYDDEATRLRADNNRMPPLPNLHLSKSSDESRAINRIDSGAIVLAGSGMCNGGRILHHLKHNLWKPRCQVMIAGYQAKGSLGRRLVEGRKTVRIHRDTIAVKAKIHTVGGMSAHGDEQDMADWYGRIRNHPPVFLVHGEKKAANKFRSKLEREHGAKVTLTDPGMTLDLRSMQMTERGRPLATKRD